MNKADIDICRNAFRQNGYVEFTSATDAVRINGPGIYGERLAIHKEAGSFTIYLRMNGAAIYERLHELQKNVTFILEFTGQAIAVKALREDQLIQALAELKIAIGSRQADG